jgi:hypothetical protein
MKTQFDLLDHFNMQKTCRSICEDHHASYNNKLCKLEIPLRIKVFGWYLLKGVILIKDNLAKRNWHGSKKCVFFHQDETVKHLLFQYRFAKST